MNQFLTCSSGCNSSRQRRQFESVSSELVGACFPSLPAAGQSMFRPHREAAITDIATDHEPC
jgi:hypothetical protein